MSQVSADTPAAWQAMVKFDVAEAAIAQLSEQYMPLRIGGLDDRKGLAAVHSARMHVKGLRVDVEKKRKALKADALEYGRVVDREAKRITGLLAPIEEHLSTEEQAIADEKARLKRAEEERKAAMLKERMDRLAAVRCYPVGSVVEAMDDERFAEFLAEATAKHDKEKAEEAAEQERQRLEAEKRREEEVAERKRQEAEQQRLDAERRKIDEERQKLQQQRLEIEAEKRRAEQVEQERLAAAEQERLAKAERKRLEALRPDLERLRGVADLIEQVPVPEVSAEAERTRQWVVAAIAEAVSAIRKLTAGTEDAT